MVEIISVRFKEGGKHYYFNPNGVSFQAGEGVIVETTRGMEYGECVQGNTPIDEMELTAPLRPVVRRATAEDQLTREKNKEREAEAFQICQEKILEHGLEMKLVEAEWGFEGNKVIFFFTAEGRVDFRALVKDLASALHARIELRQIGVRDEAKMLGGLGICGRPFCCSQFLDEFQPVSIKMAKTQNLSLNPTKISGTCGRLMCCLKYEQEAYEDLVKRSPKQESFVETPDGAGTVSAVNLLRQTVQVRLDFRPRDPEDLSKRGIECDPQRQGQASGGLCGAPSGGAGQAAQAGGEGGDPRPEGHLLPPWPPPWRRCSMGRPLSMRGRERSRARPGETATAAAPEAAGAAGAVPSPRERGTTPPGAAESPGGTGPGKIENPGRGRRAGSAPAGEQRPQGTGEKRPYRPHRRRRPRGGGGGKPQGDSKA